LTSPLYAIGFYLDLPPLYF